MPAACIAVIALGLLVGASVWFYSSWVIRRWRAAAEEMTQELYQALCEEEDFKAWEAELEW